MTFRLHFNLTWVRTDLVELTAERTVPSRTMFCFALSFSSPTRGASDCLLSYAYPPREGRATRCCLCTRLPRSHLLVRFGPAVVSYPVGPAQTQLRPPLTTLDTQHTCDVCVLVLRTADSAGARTRRDECAHCRKPPILILGQRTRRSRARETATNTSWLCCSIRRRN